MDKPKRFSIASLLWNQRILLTGFGALVGSRLSEPIFDRYRMFLEKISPITLHCLEPTERCALPWLYGHATLLRLIAYWQRLPTILLGLEWDLLCLPALPRQ